MDKATFLLFLDAMAFVWGAVWGSFLNVVIYRLPAGLSLVKPPSRCPKCETPLAWTDNIPIFGWVMLRGRCRHCKVTIPARYPGVELLTAALALSIWIHVAHGRLGDLEQDTLLAVGMSFFFYFYFVAFLIAITFIDLDETIIPHELTGPGVVLGLLAAWLIPRGGLMEGLWPPVGLQESLIGMVAGGGLIVLVIVGYKLVRGIEGMGGGDATLMAMCGAWVGWRGVIFVLFAASVQGLVTTLIYTLVQKLRGEDHRGEGGFLIEDVDAIDKPPEAEDRARANPPVDAEARQEAPQEKSFEQLAVPFGPFIALAALEYVLIGEWLLPWLLGM